MKRPNFVFIVADDLGFADLGCYGGRVPVSPVLDRMAAEGIRFTHGYANSPVCSPTRFALMTGRYQYRLRGAAEEPISSRTRSSRTLGLPPEHPTLPSLLKRAGYVTSLIGKWHLGALPKFGPLKSGYDHFFGFRGGAVDYYSHLDPRQNHDLWDQDVEVGYWDKNHTSAYNGSAGSFLPVEGTRFTGSFPNLPEPPVPASRP